MWLDGTYIACIETETETLAPELVVVEVVR